MYSKEYQKRLIVNADDFGLDSQINYGIVEAFKNGIVTNTSLMSCGRAFDEALELIKQNKEMGVGIHLVLNEEKPILHKDKIHTLINEQNGYLENYNKFILKIIFRRISLKEVYSELEAQILKFLSSDIRPTHIDGHKHIHLIPDILEIVIELAKRFNIPRIRISREPFINILKSKKYLRAIKVAGLSLLGNTQLMKIKTNKIRTPDYFYGLIDSGCVNEFLLIKIINSLRMGTSELMCHPGITTHELLNKYDWGYNWSEELKLLTCHNIKKIIDHFNISLIRYDEI